MTCAPPRNIPPARCVARKVLLRKTDQLLDRPRRAGVWLDARPAAGAGLQHTHNRAAIVRATHSHTRRASLSVADRGML